MPAANYCPLETAVPSLTRRRVWAHPELRSHSLLVLTFDRLHLAPLAGPPKPGAVAAVEAGADLDDALGPLATVVDLISVRRARLDLLTNSLVLDYVVGGGGTRRLRVEFATPEAADACFTKAWRRLGTGFRLEPYRRDAWSLARRPLLILAGVVAATLALALVLSIFEDFAAARAAGAVSVPAVGDLGTPVRLPKSALELLIGWLDWRVVCGAGGVAAAGVQVWLYRRVTQPPVALELRRG